MAIDGGGTSLTLGNPLIRGEHFFRSQDCRDSSLIVAKTIGTVWVMNQAFSELIVLMDNSWKV
jgi:hypothetical protein